MQPSAVLLPPSLALCLVGERLAPTPDAVTPLGKPDNVARLHRGHPAAACIASVASHSRPQWADRIGNCEPQALGLERGCDQPSSSSRETPALPAGVLLVSGMDQAALSIRACKLAAGIRVRLPTFRVSITPALMSW